MIKYTDPYVSRFQNKGISTVFRFHINTICVCLVHLQDYTLKCIHRLLVLVENLVYYHIQL